MTLHHAPSVPFRSTLALDLPDAPGPLDLVQEARTVHITIGDEACMPADAGAGTEGLAHQYAAGSISRADLLEAGFLGLDLRSVTDARIDAALADAPLALRLTLTPDWCPPEQAKAVIDGTVFGDVVEVGIASRAWWWGGVIGTVHAELGGGDDLFRAIDHKWCLATNDRVWGGSGDDIVRTGAGNDALFGDFGGFWQLASGRVVSEAAFSTLSDAHKQGATHIAETADPAELRLSFGDSARPEDWVEQGAKLYFRLWQDEGADAQDSQFVTEFNGSATHIAQLDPNRYLDAEGNLVSGEFVPGRQTDAVWQEYSAGLGVDTPTQGFTVTSGALDKSGNQNPEINASAFETRPCLIEGEDPPGGKLNYVESVWDGGRGLRVDGVAYAVPRSDLLGVALHQDATEAKLTFSMLYGDERGSISETVLVVLRDSSQADPTDPANSQGKVVGYALVSGSTETEAGVLSQGGVTAVVRPFQAPGANAEANDPVPSDSTGTFGTRQPGLLEVSLSGLPEGVTFDTIEVRSGGYWQPGTGGTWVPAAQPPEWQFYKTDVSDLLLREVCVEVPATEGNDVLDAGDGRDLLAGGGDTATVSAKITIEYHGSLAGFSNGYGIYDRSTGEGRILDGNVKTGAATYHAAVELDAVDDLGLFALINARNDHLNGKAVTVGQGHVAVDGGGTQAAVFTHDALNGNGQRQAISDGAGQINLHRDGRGVAERHREGVDAGNLFADRIGFEDLTHARRDHDYNDVVLRARLDVTVEGGDVLRLGHRDCDRDVVTYDKGDGFDRIFQFEDGRGTDEIHLRGFTAGQVNLIEGARVNGAVGTLITFDGQGADQGIFVEGAEGLRVADQGGWLLIG